MKNIKKNLIAMLLGVTASACMATGGVFAFSQGALAKADEGLEAEFTNNGQFALSLYTGNEAYAYTFADSTEEGLPAGATGSVLKMQSWSTGAPYVNIDFTASKINTKFVESVVARVCAPDYTAEDELRINNTPDSLGGANAYDLSTWCDVELPLNLITGADGNLGSFAFGMRDKGDLSTYFYIDSITVNMKQATAVTFTGINLYWNNYNHEAAGMMCSILEFSGGIGIGNLDGDYSDVYAKATLNGQPVDTANLSFVCRKWVDGQGDSIVMRWVNNPMAGSVLHIPAGARFTNGNEDPNIYAIAEDIYLKFNGEKWAPCQAPVPVKFNQINVVWNNYAHPQDGAPCLFLEFNGGISGNGNLDADFSALLSEMTINGEAVDTNNLSIYCPNWIGAEGGIVLRFETNPEAGAEMVLPAGATFTIGGTDTNLYQIEKDVCLKFDGTIWSTFEKYGTPTFGAATDTYVGAWSWNHNTSEAVNKNTNYGYTIVADWKLAEAKTDNLAATDNLTSRSITLNGKSFYELYQEDDGYRLNAMLEGNFGFSVPTSALVASNGYDYPTIEIVEGTPFYNGNYLPETTLIYKDGAWQLGADYTPAYKGIGVNHLDNPNLGDLGSWGLSLQYNTFGFTAPEAQVMATEFYGFSLNNEGIGVALWGEDQLLFWLGKDKCEADYNGFSHATLKIDEGAYIVNEAGMKYTFEGLTFYLVDGQWTTEQPADYEVDYVESVSVTFDGVASAKTYYAGDLLDEPETPVKESDEMFEYEFDGWYVGETKWDFANDRVTGDTALTSKFIEIALKCAVSIVSEGLAQNFSENYMLNIGETVDTSNFAREGYTYKIYAGDTEVDSIVAGEITEYRVVYTAIVVEPEQPDDSSDSSDSTDSSESSTPDDSTESSTPDDSTESSTPDASDEPETPSSSDEPETPNSSDEPETPSTSDEPETPASSEPEAPTTSSSEEEKGGCGSVVATSAVGVAVLAGAAMLLKKKKED
ncbi:MAG: hypothetical protein E7371_05210 [Clostridiales bacterium]|nr:hypothetical protein [Clostridiales bacterium]